MQSRVCLNIDTESTNQTPPGCGSGNINLELASLMTWNCTRQNINIYEFTSLSGMVSLLLVGFGMGGVAGVGGGGLSSFFLRCFVVVVVVVVIAVVVVVGGGGGGGWLLS